MAANNHSEIVLSSPPCSPTHSPQAVHTNKEQCSSQGIHPETTPGYYAYYPAPPQQHPGSPPGHPYPGGPPQPGHQYPGGPPPGHPYPGPPPGHPYPGGPPPGYYGPPDHQGPYGPPAGYYPQYGPPPPSGQHSYHFYPAQHADEPMHADAQPPNSHASTTQSSTAFVPAAQPIQVSVEEVDSGHKEKRPMSNAKKAVLASAAVVFGLSLPSLIFFFPLGVLLLLVAGFLFLIALCMW